MSVRNPGSGAVRLRYSRRNSSRCSVFLTVFMQGFLRFFSVFVVFVVFVGLFLDVYVRFLMISAFLAVQIFVSQGRSSSQ